MSCHLDVVSWRNGILQQGAGMRHCLVLSIVLLTTSAVLAEHYPVQCTPQIGFFIAIGYARLQTSDNAYIFGATNLPSDSVLSIMCYDFIGQGSHIVSKDTTVTVAQNGLFQVSVAPRGSDHFKSNMICSVTFHAWNQPPAVLKVTGRHGEKLGNPGINSQVGIYSGGQYLEAETVLH
jgi:hypothetical protein